MTITFETNKTHLDNILKRNFNLTPEEKASVLTLFQNVKTNDDLYTLAKFILMIEQKAEYISIPAINRTAKLIAVELMAEIYNK